MSNATNNITFTKIDNEGFDALYIARSGDKSFFVRRVDEETSRYMYSEVTITKRSYWQSSDTIEGFKFQSSYGDKTRKECAKYHLLDLRCA